jgi:polysaccharide biosynthesis transport protein
MSDQRAHERRTTRDDGRSVTGGVMRRRVRRYAGFIAACGLIAGVAAGVVVFVRDPVYTSEATVLLSPRLSIDPSADLEAARSLETEAQVMMSGLVLEAAADEASFSVPELVAAVEATAVTNTRLIRITAVGPSPEVAQRRTDAVVGAYQQYRIEAQGQEAADYGAYIATELARIEGSRASAGTSPPPADPAVAALEAERERLLTDLEVVRSTEQSASGGVSVVDAPSVPGSWSYPMTAIRDVAIGLVLGLLIGAAIAVLRAMTTNTVLSGRDVEDRFDLRVLGDVELPVTDIGDPVSSSADMADLRRALAVRGAHRLVVAGVGGSPTAATGTALRLGVAAASSGTSVLLISAYRDGGELLGGFDPGRRGLDAVAEGRAVLDDVLVPPRATGVPDLSFVPCGPGGDVLAILSSVGMATLMREASTRWSLLVLVCPAADAPLVAAVADAGVLALAAGDVDESQVESAERGLVESGIPVLGVVLARIRRRFGVAPRHRDGGAQAAPSPAVHAESGV